MRITSRERKIEGLNLMLALVKLKFFGSCRFHGQSAPRTWCLLASFRLRSFQLDIGSKVNILTDPALCPKSWGGGGYLGDNCHPPSGVPVLKRFFFFFLTEEILVSRHDSRQGSLAKPLYCCSKLLGWHYHLTPRVFVMGVHEFSSS